MTTFRSFASGSSGNASLVSHGDTHVLIDMGISCRRVCQSLSRLGLTPGDLSAILITHEHADHISGLATYLKKYRTPIICTPGTGWQLEYRLAGVGPLLRPAAYGESVAIGALTVTLLPTSHDCAQTCGFLLAAPDGAVGYLTDTGYVPEETGRRLLGADLLVLESNYDEDMLRYGPYPFDLKRRILGERGHLSNDMAAAFAASCAYAGTREILLAHLSKENNTPGRALDTVGAALTAAGWTGRLAALPREDMSPDYQLEGTRCSG